MNGMLSWANTKLSTVASAIKQTGVQIATVADATFSYPKALYEWTSSKITIMSKAVSQTAAQILAIANMIITIPITKKSVYRFLFQALEGFSRISDPRTMLTLISSPRTRQTFLQSGVANVVFYLGLSLLFEASMRTAEVFATPAAIAVNLAGLTCLMLVATRMFIDNTLYNMCVAKAVTDENAATEYVKSCECGRTEAIKASLASPFYYIGNLAGIYMISLVPWVGPYAAFPLRALNYGQCFLGYTMSRADLCTVHRYQLLNKNHAYAFGMGSSFLGLTKLGNYLLYSMLGLESVFITDAIFSLLFQYYIMSAMLIDKSLPGTEEGFDITYRSRLAVESILKNLSGSVTPIIRNPIIRQSLTRKINDLMHLPLICAIKRFLVGDEKKTLDEFLTNLMKWRAMNLLLNLYGDDVQQELKKIIAIRKKMYMRQVKIISRYMPNWIVSEDFKKLIDIVMAKQLGNVITVLDKAIIKAKKRPESLPVISRLLGQEVAIKENYLEDWFENKDDYASWVEIDNLLENYSSSIEVQRMDQTPPQPILQIEGAPQTPNPCVPEQDDSFIDEWENNLVLNQPLEEKTPPISQQKENQEKDWIVVRAPDNNRFDFSAPMQKRVTDKWGRPFNMFVSSIYTPIPRIVASPPKKEEKNQMPVVRFYS